MDDVNFLIQNIFPTIALIISILAYNSSRKVNALDKRLKEYELGKIKNELEKSKRACVEASIQKKLNGNYILQILNSGQATAYNVNFISPEEIDTTKEKVPYEILESGKHFDVPILLGMGSPTKFEVTTIWDDEEKLPHSKKQIVSY